MIIVWWLIWESDRCQKSRRAIRLRGFLLKHMTFHAYSHPEKLVVNLKVQLNTQLEVANEARDSLKFITKEHDLLKESKKNKNEEAKKFKKELARVRT